MVQLKPILDNSFVCPKCDTQTPIVREIRFESVNVLADCTCTKCGFEFYQSLPVGHTSDTVISMGKNGLLYPTDDTGGWLSKSIRESIAGYKFKEVAIEKIVFKEYRNVIILNTLDSLYGHVLLKLYNASYHLDHDPEKGLIIIIPKIFKWLIPEGCAEAWIVDLSLGKLIYGYSGIQEFVANECKRFNEIFLSKAFSHPNFIHVDISRFTQVMPFDLDQFYNKPPMITFVLREDRWWWKNSIDYWLYRVLRKLKILSWAAPLLSVRQNSLVKKTIRFIREEAPEALFSVVGLGRVGNFNGFANDERQSLLNDSTEHAWCKIYAQSHIVIGVHGSNMLLPTAFAAGCVEVLPEDRYENIVQDISVRYTDRLQLFFYRFVDQFSSPRSVAGKALSIIRGYKDFRKNMGDNTYL